MFLKKINKDKIRRYLNNNIEIKLIALKCVIKYFKREYLIFHFSNLFGFLDKNFFFSKANNLCILTGRQSGVYKVCKISRIELRNSKYDIYGFKKSSW